MNIRRLHPQLLVTRTITSRLATRGYPVLGMPSHGTDFCSKCARDVEFVKKKGGWIHLADESLMCKGATSQAIKALIKARKKHSIYVIDYSQIELRTLAELSQDKEMKRAYIKGIDLHALTAYGCLNAPEKKEDQDPHRHRLPAKTVNFSMVMGTTPSGLTSSVHDAGNMEWSKDCPGCKSWKAPHVKCDSVRMMDGWFKLYKGAAAWMESQKEAALEDAIVRGLWGMEWYLPGVWCEDAQAREGTLRQCHALPVQEGAQRLMSQAMARVYYNDLPWAREKKAKVNPAPFLQQHDSLLFEVETSFVPEWHNRVKKTMESIVKWSIPVIAEGSFGPSWLEQKEIP